jgi:hypothetical protein
VAERLARRRSTNLATLHDCVYQEVGSNPDRAVSFYGTGEHTGCCRRSDPSGGLSEGIISFVFVLSIFINIHTCMLLVVIKHPVISEDELITRTATATSMTKILVNTAVQPARTRPDEYTKLFSRQHNKREGWQRHQDKEKKQDLRKIFGIDFLEMF